MIFANCLGNFSPHCVLLAAQDASRSTRCFFPVRLQTPPGEVQKYSFWHNAVCSLSTASFFTDQTTSRVVFRKGFPRAQGLRERTPGSSPPGSAVQSFPERAPSGPRVFEKGSPRSQICPEWAAQSFPGRAPMRKSGLFCSGVGGR